MTTRKAAKKVTRRAALPVEEPRKNNKYYDELNNHKRVEVRLDQPMVEIADYVLSHITGLSMNGFLVLGASYAALHFLPLVNDPVTRGKALAIVRRQFNQMADKIEERAAAMVLARSNVANTGT